MKYVTMIKLIKWIELYLIDEDENENVLKINLIWQQNKNS